MKEARIILPYGEQGSLKVHRELRDELVAAFGGYTAFTGDGGWQSNEHQQIITDQVLIYDIAVEEDRDAAWDALFQIALKYGRKLEQEAVYIRYPDGSVVIEPVHGREGLEALMPAMPHVGTKRTPGVGETWRTSQEDLVAVVSNSTKVGGGFNVVILKPGSGNTSWKPGATFLTDLDGHVLPDKSSHPRDLKRFVGMFDR